MVNGVSEKKFSLARLQLILERQTPQRFGADYVPAIFATASEAPSKGEASGLQSAKIGREIQLLSQGEQAAALVALFHPCLFDLHEQKMLSCEPRVHPLCGHPFAIGLELPSLRGTVDVADRLSTLDLHPFIRVRKAGKRLEVPWPLLGDLLLFLADDAGPYCVNWTIKADDEGFRTRRLGERTTQSPDDDLLALCRAEWEATYYFDAGVPTMRVVRDTFHPILLQNLRQLFLWQHRAHSIPAQMAADLETSFSVGLQRGVPPWSSISDFVIRAGVAATDCKAVLYQSIWHRRIRVDLFSRFLINKPMRPENRDPLVVYSRLFARTG